MNEQLDSGDSAHHEPVTINSDSSAELVLPSQVAPTTLHHYP